MPMLDGSWLLAMRRAGLAVVLTMPAGPVTARPQDTACDPSLTRPSPGPQGYRMHGDRCEGTYVQPVAGTPLWLASLTESFEPYDLTSRADLVVEWTPPGNRRIQLRAQGVKRDLYYRMDAIRPAASRSYRWPSDLLSAEHITADRIGVLGWARYPIEGVEQNVYLPLRITQHDPAAPSDAVDLVLFPTVELTEIYLSIATLEDDGRPRRWIVRGDSLGHGFYPAGRAVHVKLRQVRDPGLYYVELAAVLAPGGSHTLRHWIFRGR